MAAEVLSQAGVQVDLFDAMPSVGRKFLLAGKGGMNLTHAEPKEIFLTRYGARQAQIEPLLTQFDADALRAWAHALGIETFVGTSGRVFPTDMKAAPLLRAWLHRLRESGVRFHMRHRWLGWQKSHADIYELCFSTPLGEKTICAESVVLALGGGSWANLGSNGAWVPWLKQQGIEVIPLQPANCGFDVRWSEHFRNRYAGHALKNIALRFTDTQSHEIHRQGEFIITENGVEGSLIYALSAPLRNAINATGFATLTLDLAPGKSLQRVIDEVSYPRGSRSIASHLQSKVGITGVKAGLLRECLTPENFSDLNFLARSIKALPIQLNAPRPLDEAISSAGGISFSALDARLMLRHLPGVFCAGEMLDWEAPTGGYLLTACFASGRAAGLGALEFLQAQEH